MKRATTNNTKTETATNVIKDILILYRKKFYIKGRR